MKTPTQTSAASSARSVLTWKDEYLIVNVRWFPCNVCVISAFAPNVGFLMFCLQSFPTVFKMSVLPSVLINMFLFSYVIVLVMNFSCIYVSEMLLYYVN